MPKQNNVYRFPDLLSHLGLGALAKQSAKCPFHDDKRNSFSVYKNGSGEFRFKCHAGCGSGDEIDFLELYEKLPKRDAIKRYCELAGVNGSKPLGTAFKEAKAVMSKPVTLAAAVPVSQTFDWQKCRDAFTEKHLEWLSDSRGYCGEFCSWLHKCGFVGLYDGCIAFPVHETAESLRRTCARRTALGTSRRKAQRRAHL